MLVALWRPFMGKKRPLVGVSMVIVHGRWTACVARHTVLKVAAQSVPKRSRAAWR